MGRLGGLLGGSRESTWQGDVEDLLYEGEDIDHRVDLGEGQVVITSHRLLVFTPGGPGNNFTQVDRPNVVGFELGHEGNAAHVERAVRYGLIGLIMVGAGMVVDFDDIVGDVSIDPSAGRVGLGQLLGLMQQLLAMIAVLDRLLMMFGALAILLAVFVALVYVLTRERVIVIELAGEDDVHLPVSTDVTSEEVQRVRTVLTSTSGSSPPGKASGDSVESPSRTRPDDATAGPTDGQPTTRSDGDGSLKSDDPLGAADGRDGGP